MNFKNSDFLMLLVAFLVGYLFQEIMNGGDIIEGNNTCTCSGGTAADTGSCPHNNLEYCVSCTDGSKPREDTTKKDNTTNNINDSEYYCKNKCTCKYGTPVDGDNCPHMWLEKCKTCDDNSSPVESFYKKDNLDIVHDSESYCVAPYKDIEWGDCKCDNGEAGIGHTDKGGKCPIRGGHIPAHEDFQRCKKCDDGNPPILGEMYGGLIERWCHGTKTKCTCENGTPVKDKDCKKDGTEQCEYCWKGYGDPNTKAEPLARGRGGVEEEPWHTLFGGIPHTNKRDEQVCPKSDDIIPGKKKLFSEMSLEEAVNAPVRHVNVDLDDSQAN